MTNAMTGALARQVMEQSRSLELMKKSVASEVVSGSVQYTIQDLPDVMKGTGDSSFFDYYTHGRHLPKRATQQRERYLRDNVYYHDDMWMARGGFSGIMKKVGATPFEIKGPGNLSYTNEKVFKQAAAILGFALPGEERTDIEYLQQIIRLADFGAGFASFCEQGVDFLRQDRGWIWEFIYPGDPNTEPEGPLMGIAHLDSLKCRPTGDPDFPMLYFDKYGKKHIMHARRASQLVDMLDGDERKPGYGDCALSRAISIVNQQVFASRYVETRLDDKPPPGITLMQGITKQERERAFAEYRKEQDFDERPEWGRIVFFHGMDKDTPVAVTNVPFAQAPEKFDYKVYTEIQVNALALAIGVDVQEFWQLTGGNLGSEGQSEILHQKSRGKTIGALMTSMERKINDALPDEYEFTFKYRDANEDMQNAQIASTWGSAISSMSDLSPDEKRQILANNVEAVRDAITDKDGKVIRVSDLGVQPLEIVDDLSAQSPNGQPPSELITLSAPGKVAMRIEPEAPDISASQPISEQPMKPPVNGKPQKAIATLSDVEALLNAGLITIGDAQRMVGQRPDPVLDGLYVVDGIPVPREKVSELWLSRFGRGVASFEAVVSGESAQQGIDNDKSKWFSLNTLGAPSMGMPGDGAQTLLPGIGSQRKAEGGLAAGGDVLARGFTVTDGVATAKDIEETIAEFEADFSAAMAAMQSGDVERRRFGIIARAQLSKYGRRAMIDGLEVGGVEVDSLEGDDADVFAGWLAEQSGYVTNLGAEIKDGAEFDSAERVKLWVNKSLLYAHELGKAQADLNGMYGFEGEDGEESCETCQRLKGQKHRLKDVNERNLNPKLPGFIGECGGWKCQHGWVKTTGRARGNY